jgi:single-strand DNA-binding protein
LQGLNKVTLIGNLGKDPEINLIDGNVKVARFNMATSETYKDPSGTKQTLTEWHTIVAWRGLADLAEKYLKKGSSVYIEGKLRSRSYDDKENRKIFVTEIQVDQLIMLDKPKALK